MVTFGRATGGEHSGVPATTSRSDDDLTAALDQRIVKLRDQERA
ncbi:MAG TPA: hypothetical protein VGG75_05220 [Trebonia sp.]|jgi:hypothetical protein